MEEAGVKLVAQGADKFFGDMSRAGKAVDDFASQADSGASRATGALSRIGGVASQALGGLATVAAGAALAVGTTLVGGLAGVATVGLSFNNSVEQATARINAFTKDSGKTAEILDMVRERAAKTPFAFEEMAEAAASLGPAANSAGIPLEELIAQAEILAASNPAEGLVGGAFAIKEALSGDFTSAIERFNLSRSYINQLKDEGVPALEILSRAMQQAGYDADLVSALAETAGGRWSTFTDTFVNLAGIVTQPIFDAFSSGLGLVNDELEGAAPAMETTAKAIGEALAPAAAALGEAMVGAARGLVAVMEAVTNADGSLKSFGEIWATLSPVVGEAVGEMLGRLGEFALGVGKRLLDAIPGAVSALGQLGARLIGWVGEQLPGWSSELGKLAEAGGKWVMDAIPPLISNLADMRTRLVSWVLDSLPEWASRLDDLRTAAIDWVAKALPDLGTNLGKVTALLLEKTGEFIATTGPKLLELAGTFITWVATEALPRLPGELVKIGTALVTGIGNFIAEVSPKLIELANQFIDWVQNEVLPKAPGEIAKIGTAIVTGIGEFIGNVGSEAAKVGSAIIDGIAGAISSGVGSVIAAAKQAALDALSAAKAALGISSPSKVFAEEVGVPITQGIAEGVLSAVGEAEAAIEQLGEGMEDKAKELAQRITEAFKTGIDFLGALGGSASGLATIQEDLFKAEERYRAARDGTDPAEYLAAQQGLRAAQAAANRAFQREEQAQQTALQIGAMDPARAAAFLSQRTQQLAAVADLEERIAAAQGRGNATGVNLLQRQLGLLRERQGLELRALAQGAADPVQQLISGAALSLLGGGGGGSTSTVTNFNYSPSYGGPAPNPSQDFAAMRLMSA